MFIDRIEHGEITVMEVARRLNIKPKVVQMWINSKERLRAIA